MQMNRRKSPLYLYILGSLVTADPLGMEDTSGKHFL